MDLLKDLMLDNAENKPKYLQIVDCIIDNVSRGNLKMGEKIPSINEFSKAYNLSRDTVEKGYKVLKEKKVVKVVKAKGTYINSTELISKVNVLFLINKLSPYKLEIYNSFCNSVGPNYHIDFEIYNCDESLFIKLMEKNSGRYDYYIVMPHFKNNNESQTNFSVEALEIIKSIPEEKLVIMDNNELKIEGNIIEIFQDFENDIFNALQKGWNKIKKYNKINLVLSEENNYSYLMKIKKGFLKFCEDQSINYGIMDGVNDYSSIVKENLYVVVKDDDLVNLIDLSNAKKFVIGKDVGILSFNETPLKRLLNVAVLTTDFEAMGTTAAKMIFNNLKGKIKNPFFFIDRDSI